MEFDPQYPNRPQHPDFDLACQKMGELDQSVNLQLSREEFEERCGRMADAASIDYLSEQRAQLMIMWLDASVLKIPAAAQEIVRAALATAWSEGFYVGNLFSAAKQAEECIIPDSPEGLV